MGFKFLCVVCFLTLYISPVHAETLKYVDDEGVIHYKIQGTPSTKAEIKEIEDRTRKAQGEKAQREIEGKVAFYCSSTMGNLDLKTIDQLIQQGDPIEAEIQNSTLVPLSKAQNLRNLLLCKKSLIIQKRDILKSNYKESMKNAEEYKRLAEEAKKLSHEIKEYLQKKNGR